MIYGYQRPLFDDKDMHIQTAILMDCDQVFTENHGRAKKRIALEELLMTIEKGDTIRIHRFFSIADSTRHLEELLKICKRDQVTLHFMEENITSTQLLEKSLEQVLQFFLRFQSDIVKQSTTLGMADAKAKGKSIGRPKKSDDNVKKAIDMYQSGKFTLLDIKNETGISKSTLYRYLETIE
ncbi:recombinase family protein [Solibacillus sp. FSL K6-1126]|uniref:recombinase family protein n=1 Tax=Solibacillus sp. FSL K6-1126 TaxID=2921463 RepID=UPI0030FBF29F